MRTVVNVQGDVFALVCVDHIAKRRGKSKYISVSDDNVIDTESVFFEGGEIESL